MSENHKNCDPADVALKTFFLGPQAENIDQVSEIFAHMIYRWAQYRRAQFPSDGPAISSKDQTSAEFQKRRQNIIRELDHLLSEFESEIPKFSPRYLGHMFSEISLPALYGSFLALLHNPNNISAEASYVGLKIEREAIHALTKMVGYSRAATGHFTSCGTIANFEAALRAREHSKFKQKLAFFFPKHAHYSWEKIGITMGLPASQIFWIDLDKNGRLSTESLNQKIKEAVQKKYNPSFVVSVLGTTEFGICDSISEIADLLDHWHKKKGISIWHHIDGAYGGFFSTLKDKANGLLDSEVRRSLRAISRVDSMTIDPHKLGYVPYASGAFLCKSQARYQMKKISSPYLHDHKNSSALWTFEGSRSAAGAISIAMTHRTLGFHSKGFGKILELSLEARMLLESGLKAIPNIRILPVRDLNILSFVIAKEKEATHKVSQRSLSIYKQLSSQSAHPPYMVTKTLLDRARYDLLFREFIKSWNGSATKDLTVIRLCLMNPFLTSKEPRISYLKDFVETLSKICKNLR